MARSKAKVAGLIKGEPTDLIIPIIGQTGAGKSTFVNNLNTESGVKFAVSSDLGECTLKLQSIVVRIPGGPLKNRRLVLVDTPGFDGSSGRGDSQIFEQVAQWLVASYDSKMKVAGIIYLHEISQDRMSGSARKSFGMFQQLCGTSALSAVVLGTTKWDKVDHSTGEHREQELQEKFWKEMIERGSAIRRFHNTCESGWAIVDYVLQTNLDATVCQLEQNLDSLLGQSRTTAIVAEKAAAAQQILIKHIKGTQQRSQARVASPQLQAEYVKAQEEIRQILRYLYYSSELISRGILIVFDVTYTFQSETKRSKGFWKVLWSNIFSFL